MTEFDEFPPRRLRFGQYEVDLRTGELWRAGRRRKLTGQPFSVLAILLEHPGEVVSREELQKRLWPDTFVDADHNLNAAINKIREALNDSSERPRFIETLSRRGYRFVAPVDTVGPEQPPLPKQAESEPTIVSESVGDGIARTIAEPLAPAVEPESQRPHSSRSSGSRAGGEPVRRIWLRRTALAAAVLVMVGVGLGLVFLTPAAPTGPLESTQISFSNEEKLGPLRTDGTRLYFQSHMIPSEMSVDGGLITPIPGLSPGMFLVDLSADGSKVLVWGQKPDETPAGGFLVGSTLGGGLRRIAADQPTNPKARWSADGKSIYFVRWPEVWVMDADGDHARFLWKPTPPQVPEALAVSPDGKQVLVTIISFAKGGTWPDSMWLMGSDGKDPHPLEMDRQVDAAAGGGEWSPDGKHFVFGSGTDALNIEYELTKPPWFEFWKKPKPVPLTGDQMNTREMVPARDSKSLFVLGAVESGTMEVLDPRAGKLVPFLGGRPMQQFVVSPDRQWMAYTEYPSKHLWKSRLDGSDAVELTKGRAQQEQWSPDGKWIVFSDSVEIYRVAAEGGTPQLVIAKAAVPKDATENFPTYSPDGKSIIFQWGWAGNAPQGLHVADVETGKVTPMPGGEQFFYAKWSPDGRYLAAEAGDLRLVIYSSATKEWRTLAQFVDEIGFYAWSPDSRSIYITQPQTHTGIDRVSVPDGARQRVSDVPDIPWWNDAFVSVTADGQPAIMANTGAAQVYSLRWK